MTPNDNFKELRNTLGLTQTEFAAKLSVSQATITDIERGRIGVSKKVAKKINEIFGIETGYFTPSLQLKNNELKQGDETGARQGFDGNAKFYAKQRIEDIRGKRRKVNAADLTDHQILLIRSKRNSNIHIENITDDRQQILNKLFEKQRVIAEKVISSLASENPAFDEFKNDILAIQSFTDLMDDIINCDEINDLIKIEDSARHYPSISFSEFKTMLNDDFSKLQPYAHIFSELANAMKTFAHSALQIPQNLTGIDELEFTEYLALNKKNEPLTQKVD